MRWDVLVYRINGTVRVWAYGLPEADAKQALWVAVRENTREADRTQSQFASRVELRESQP